jgi:hypothetical protein
MENITLSRRAVFAIGAIFVALLLLVVFLFGRASVAQMAVATPQAPAATATPSSTLTGTWLWVSAWYLNASHTAYVHSVEWMTINAGVPGSADGTVTIITNHVTDCHATDVHTYPANSADSDGTYTFTCYGGRVSGAYTANDLTMSLDGADNWNFKRATTVDYQNALANTP